VVYEITGSGALLGAVLGARAIPMLLLAPLAGVAADRYDRRALMQAGQIMAAAVAAAFGAALALEIVGTWMLFAFTLLMGTTYVLDRPARHTTAFELVPRELAVRAMALNTVGFSLTRIVGPAIAGYLIAWVGAAGNFFIQGILCAASAAMVLGVSIPRRPAVTHARSAWSAMLEGLRFAAANPATRALFVLGALPFFLMVPIWGTLYPIYAKDVFDAGPQGLGILLTAIGLGGTLGGLIANALGRAERQGLIQVAAVLVLCAALAGVALSGSFALAVAFSVLAGTGEMVLAASNMAMLQMTAPEAMRGRIASLMQVYPALISLGAVIAGPLAELAGVRAATLGVAAAAAAITVLLFAASPQLRGLRLSRYH
jgi:MFS family permease